MTDDAIEHLEHTVAQDGEGLPGFERIDDRTRRPLAGPHGIVPAQLVRGLGGTAAGPAEGFTGPACGMDERPATGAPPVPPVDALATATLEG